MNLCLACHAAEPVETLSPFCSVECLNADPRQSKSTVLHRLLAAFDDRDTGAGGPGGMVPTRADDRLRWYLAGALDTRADGLAANRVLQRAERSTPDDLRAEGWSVAVHNDYRQHSEPRTFWLLTKDGRAVKGEGRTDAEALDQVRRQVFDEVTTDPGKLATTGEGI